MRSKNQHCCYKPKMRDTSSFTKGIGLVISRGSFMAARTANVQIHYLAGDFGDKLNEAVVPRLTALNPSSDRWTHLPGLNAITAEYGGTCWYQGKNIVSVQMSQSNMVETNASWPPPNSAKTYSPNSNPSSNLVGPIPLVSLASTLYYSSSCTTFYSDACLLLYSAPPVTHHLQFITTCQVMVHYQALDLSDTDDRLFRAYNDTSPL